MDLLYTGSSNGNGDGIFTSKARILGVEDMSGVTDGNRTNDLSLHVKLQVDGVTWEPTFYISGDFDRSKDTNEVVAVGRARRVLDFIKTVTGIEEIPLTEAAGYKIDPAILQELVGKEFYRLVYRSGKKEDGKSRFSTWSTVGTADSDPEKLREQFLRGFKERGFPRNYVPATKEEDVDAGF